MFYSQTFLARKGPLGTVWCAAHLQHRLKKSHYTATDIPSTVDRIIYPEVPIALRMYSHLLLGVVRIYSKKVDYLFHDCNIILIGLRKVFTAAQVDLPEDARQAPVQAVTLPETFDLDAMEFDVEISVDGAFDNHLSTQEDITLTDQIPIGRDPYVAITFDDDIMMDAAPHPEEIHTSSSPHEPPDDHHVDVQDPGADNPIDVPRASAASQDTSPSNQMHVPAAEGDYESPGPHNQTGVQKLVSNDSPQSVEVRRDAPRDLSPENPFPVHSDLRNDPTEVTGSMQQVGNEKETNTPSSNMLPSEGPSMPFREHSDPPTSAASKGPPEVSFGYSSPQLVIQPSPPVQQPVQQARQRQVRRKRFFDEELVLPNRLMKRALEDYSDLVKKRRKIPCSALGIWKLKNSLRMEHVFNEPSLTGSSAAISNMFNREYISTKPHLVVTEEVVPEPLLVVPEEVVPEPTVPQSTTPMTEVYQEIQHLRHIESNTTDNVLPQLSSPARSMPSPCRTDNSPSSINSLESELGPNAAFSAIPEFGGSEIDTPGFSAIPGFESSEADLKFLEEDDSTPTDSQASKGVNSLSQRTRQVATYLKMHSPITPISEDLHGDLSLNKILEGKRRKICARMFYETLVLKSHDLVDVRQEEPYGDIILKLTPTLSKSQI